MSLSVPEAEDVVLLYLGFHLPRILGASSANVRGSSRGIFCRHSTDITTVDAQDGGPPSNFRSSLSLADQLEIISSWSFPLLIKVE